VSEFCNIVKRKECFVFVPALCIHNTLLNALRRWTRNWQWQCHHVVSIQVFFTFYHTLFVLYENLCLRYHYVRRS